MKNKTLLKTLSVILAVLVVLCSAPLSGFTGIELPLDSFSVKAEAEEYTEVNFTFSVSDGEATITGCVDATGDIVIPSTLGGYPVTSIGDDAFYNCSNLTSVTIPDSVTSIGEGAFYSCANLTDVYYNGTKEEWNKNIIVEDYNDELFAATIHFAGTSIPAEDFEYRIENGEVTITGYTGTDEEVIIPSEIEGYPVTVIDDSAFSNSESIISVEIPDSITSIGDYAFCDCDSLTSVTIGDSVIRIGDEAFVGCVSLTSVTIGNSVTSIGYYAFADCESLTSITVDSDNQYYSSDEYGVLYNKDKTSLIQYPIGNSRTTFEIPDSVTNIDFLAFYCSFNLTSIMIPDTVITIDEGAFYGCIGLASIEIPDSVIIIANHAFYHCTSLESVEIPDSVTYIGAGAFQECTSLESIEIPDSVIYIGSSVCQDCTSLKNVKIPDNSTTIGDYAFAGCTSLTSIELPDSIYIIPSGMFINCENLKTVNFGDSIICVNNYVFYGCSNLTDVYYNGTETEWKKIIILSNNKEFLNATIHFDGSIVEYYGDFEYTIENGEITITCYTGSDKDIVIPTVVNGYSVTEIGNWAFSNCENLESIKIPDGVEEIGVGSFGSCTNLKSIEISDSVTKIATRAFANCTSLTSITIPDGVTWIGSRAFDSCTSLTSIVVDENNGYYSSDEYGVLYNKEKTTLVQYPIGNSRNFFETPDNVTTIGVYAFSGCENLQAVVIGNGVTNIGYCAFVYCVNLTSVTIGNGVTVIVLKSFGGCENLTDVYYYGNQENWNRISMIEYNEELLCATLHFICSHEHTSIATSPTCTTLGYTTYFCSICEDSYIADYVDATGHIWSDWQISVEPTETEEGTEAKMCEVCEELEKRSVSPTGICILLTNTQGNIVSEQYFTSETSEVSFENLEDGEYTLTVSKESYVTREYIISVEDGKAFCEFDINKIGDITGDYKLNTIDVARANSHAKGVSTLTDYALACADVNGDGKVNTIDVARINSHAKGVSTLW